jgi:hypothetical protein
MFGQKNREVGDDAIERSGAEVSNFKLLCRNDQKASPGDILKWKTHALPPAQWLPKPAMIYFPEKRRSVGFPSPTSQMPRQDVHFANRGRETWSPEERVKQKSGFRLLNTYKPESVEVSTVQPQT